MNKLEIKNVLPINHISYSWVKDLISNPYKFYKTYILKEYNNDTKYALYVWTLIHNWIERIWNMVKDWDINIDIVLAGVWSDISTFDKTVLFTEYKTPEMALYDVQSTLIDYVNNIPKYIPIECEQTHIFENDEDILLPIKTKIDLVCESEWKIWIIDHKSATIWYTCEQWKRYPDKDLQAWCYALSFLNKYWTIPEFVRFDQVLKWDLNPFKWMKKSEDYQKICDSLWISYLNEKWKPITIPVMKETLLMNPLFESPKRIIPYTIENIEECMKIFMLNYKRALKKVYTYIKYDLEFERNYFDERDWDEIYLDDLKNI